jgi:hypothetical protein
MHPSSTNYRLATEKDRFTIYEHFDLTSILGWPVVIAEREDKIIGFFGTQDRKDVIVAGPMGISIKIKGFVAMRLVEAYDNLMRSFGVKEYLFSIDSKNNAKWLKQVHDTGFCTKMDDVEDESWYKREL